MQHNIHYYILCFFYLCAWLLSSATQANTALIQADLQHFFPDNERIELSEDPSFMALFLPKMTGFTNGSVILIPDIYQHPASPKYINFLRQNLPDLGWNSLAIMPPTLPNLDEASFESYQQQLKIRTLVAINYASLQPGAIIIIAQGNSGAIVNKLLAEQELPAVSALVMLGGYIANPKLNRELAQAISSHAVPVLDIANSLDNKLALTELKLRQQLVAKNFKAIYRQRLITGSGYDTNNQHWVLQQIYGWLSSLGL